MSENSYRRACRTSELRPRCIFFAKTTLPHDADAGPRPYLAIKKINNQIIALPLTSLEKKVSPTETYEEICIRHKRSERDYYPIHPNKNAHYDSITQPPPSGGNSCSVGWIDLITPMTIGTKNITKGKIVYEISQPDLDKVIKAYASRMGFQHLGLSNECLGACSRVPGMAQKIKNILNITKTLLQASEDKASTQGENERCFKEMIRICNDLDTTPPPSPPHGVISSSEIPADIELLPARAASKRQRRRGAKLNGACNDAQLETRRTDDPNDKGGPNGGGPTGGEHYTSFPAGNKTQAGMSTSDGSKTSAQSSSGHVHCANQNPEGSCTDEDWYRIECEDQEDSETNSTEEIPGEPWQLVDYEVSYCSSESDSYASSSEPGGLDVEIWRESSADRVQNPSSAASAVIGQNQIPKEFIITRYLDGISDSRAQDSLDESLFTPSKIPQKTTTTLGLMCPKCKQTTNPRISEGEPYIEAFCEKCNTRINNWSEDVPNKYRIVRVLEGVEKLVLKPPQIGLATWYSGLELVKRLITQENRKEQNFVAELCSESSPFGYVLREERFDEDYGEILRHLDANYANSSKDECGYETAGRQPDIGNACQQFLDRNNATKISGSRGDNRSQVQQLAFPTLQYATAIQRRCDYLLRLINPAQKSLPPVHIIAKRLLEYVYSIKEISRAGRWKGVDCLETLRCGILPKEYLPANSDVLINLLRSYPLTDGDPDIQAIARLSLTNDSDLLLERINFALPRSHDDWLATDDALDNGSVQSTSEKRLLLQQDGMIKWIRFLMSTLGIGEIHTREVMEGEGSSKIEKDLLWLDSLGNPGLASESEMEETTGQRRIRSIEDLEENILGEEDKITRCGNERYGRCKFGGEARCVSVCVNNCNSEDRDRRQEP